MPLRLFENGALLSVDRSHGSPWFPLGADALGRDQLARLASGTRLSLGVALGAALEPFIFGALVGGLAGSAGGLVDDGLMLRGGCGDGAAGRCPELLALRAAMPLMLDSRGLLDDGPRAGGCGLAAAGSRRATVVARNRFVNAEAARHRCQPCANIAVTSAGRAGFLVVQTTLLVPAFVLAEATLSYVGLGFGEPIELGRDVTRAGGDGRRRAPNTAPAIAIALTASR
jgi:peptide/nickel transport system permease protein